MRSIKDDPVDERNTIQTSTSLYNNGLSETLGKCTERSELSNNDHVEKDASNEQHPLLSHDISIIHSNGIEPENNESACDDEPRSISGISFLKKVIKSVIAVYADQSGSFQNLCKGLSIILFLGTIIGLLMPFDQNFPSPWYRAVSSIVGYTYFMSWSVSYYPQIIVVYENGSIDGLSTDYTVFTTLNCICYALYNSFFFWDTQIRQEYQDERPDTPLTIDSNDVAFSIHALLVSLALTCQVAYYNGFSTSPLSWTTIGLTISVFLISGIYIICILQHVDGFRWVNFLHGMAMLKIVLASTGYIPQLILNYQRKSTKGFNMWNIYLDFNGGLLSMLQIIFDSLDLGDIKNGIAGNWAKLVLGMITLFFDSMFFIQHYILYRDDSITLASISDHDNGYNLHEDDSDTDEEASHNNRGNKNEEK